jgi:hypothetical protein
MTVSSAREEERGREEAVTPKGSKGYTLDKSSVLTPQELLNCSETSPGLPTDDVFIRTYRMAGGRARRRGRP